MQGRAFVWWNDKQLGARVHHDPPVDVLVRCTCSNEKFFRHDVARVVWPDGVNMRTIARSLTCMRCLARSASIVTWPAQETRKGFIQTKPRCPDITMAEIVAWLTAGLWWKALLASGRLPPVRFATPYEGDRWDIERTYAGGIGAMPSVDEMLAAPGTWERSR